MAIALGSVALAGPALAQGKPTVGIAMPTKASARWIDDGNNIVKVLKKRGYGTELQYAEDDIPNQLSQIENMVTKGAKVLVIASIDGTTLSDVLKQSKDKGITVIAYDRLIRDTPNVDYYATFDNFQVGVLQAQSIDRRGLKEGKGRSTSNCSAALPTTTTPTSSTTARCRCCSPTSTAASSCSRASRWAWTRSRRCAGTVPRRRPAWIIC